MKPSQRLLRPLSRQEVRDVDRRAIDEFGMTGLQLMENAGRGATDLLLSQQPTGTVLIVAGKGNNGGDGFVMARHLENAGCAVRVLLLADENDLAKDAAANFQVIQKSGLSIELYNEKSWQQTLKTELTKTEWVVDALLGTGVTGTLHEPYLSAINIINESSKSIFAVDLPSGLNCDTGEPLGVCIQANVTATFVSTKIGFHMPTAIASLGQVHVIDIGVPRLLLVDL